MKSNKSYFKRKSLKNFNHYLKSRIAAKCLNFNNTNLVNMYQDNIEKDFKLNKQQIETERGL